MAKEHQLVLSHDNGPQVGLLALQAAAYEEVDNLATGGCAGLPSRNRSAGTIPESHPGFLWGLDEHSHHTRAQRMAYIPAADDLPGDSDHQHYLPGSGN